MVVGCVDMCSIQIHSSLAVSGEVSLLLFPSLFHLLLVLHNRIWF